jgi:hypothetical protein
MKTLIAATALTLLAGCVGQFRSSDAASGTSASDGDVPLYLQNPANCAEASFACRRR